MYDDRQDFMGRKPYDGRPSYDDRSSYEGGRYAFESGRSYDGARASYSQEPPRKLRSEQAAKPKGVRGIFGGQRGEQKGGDLSNVVIYSPTTFDDVQALIDYLKRREQVIVDFTGIDQTAVYRIMDFMSGAIYALNGSIQQITSNIFLFAPSGVTITVPPQFKGRR